MKPICYWNPAKSNSRSMLQAFSAGSGAEITPALELKPGRAAVLWGVDRLTLPLWREIERTKHPFIYIDNGYFRSKWTGGDYYRVTVNAPQHSGVGESDGARWRALGLNIAPWRKSGDHILIACQSDFWHERHGHGSAAKFAERITRSLHEHTERPVIARMKPIGEHKEPPLSEHFKNCWAVVSDSSMVALEGILSGIPAFMLAKSSLDTVASRELSNIETPFYPEDRERWAGVLADNQWTLSEIKAGLAWRTLNALV